MKTTVIIGAGCTAGLTGLPADVDFLSLLRREIPKNYFLHEAIKKLFGNINASFGPGWCKERLEVCWNEIDENYNSPKLVSRSSDIKAWFEKIRQLAVAEKDDDYKYYSEYFYRDKRSRSPNEYFFMFAGWELKKLVSIVYSLHLSDDLKNKYVSLIDKINNLAKGDEVNFISLNYDTFLEQALDNCVYIGVKPNDTILNKGNRTAVIKPHGSLNWLYSHSDNRITAEPHPIKNDHMGYKNGNLFQPAIVGLVGNKRELAPSVDGSIINYTFGEVILRELKSALAESRLVIVIGYSFPMSDGYVKSAMIEGKPHKPKELILVTKANKKSEERELKEKAQSIFEFDDKIIKIESRGVEAWIDS